MISKGRVLHVITGLLPGGAETVLLEITSRLVLRGWEISVLCFRSGVLVPNFQQRGVRATLLDLPKGHPKIIWHIRNLVQQFRPDIVHTHLIEAEVMTCLALQDNPRLPIVSTRHGLDKFRQHFVNRLPNALVNRRCRYVIAVTDAIGEICLDQEMLPQYKVLKILNGIDLDRFQMRADHVRYKDSADSSLDGAEVVGTVGRLSPEKGHYYLLEAWLDVVRVFPKAVLVIIGDGVLRSKLEEKSRHLGISSSVQFMGTQLETLPRLLAGLDIFVLPSLHEGLPIALLEAMATGCPVVASRVGGIPDLVSDTNGILVPPADPPALANAIIDLSKDSNRREHMRNACRQTVEMHFDIAGTVENLINVYDSMLNNTLPRPELFYRAQDCAPSYGHPIEHSLPKKKL